MSLRFDILRLARQEIGTEEDGTTNCGKRVNEYKASTWLDPTQGWAWCAAFVCWLFKEGMEEGDYTFARPRTAAAWGFEQWALDEDDSVLLKKPYKGFVRPGDVVVFKFSHIGIVESLSMDRRTVFTIEGNTNDEGSREGGAVLRRARGVTSIRSIIKVMV